MGSSCPWAPALVEESLDVDLPEWWGWELRFIVHLQERMEERGFSEVELRIMLEETTALSPSRRPGRWLCSTHLGGRPWVVVVEPDPVEQITYVVTAYPRG